MSYTNLKGGNYTFHLKAINADDVVNSDEMNLHITKGKGLFEYYLTWVILIIALALIIILITTTIMSAKVKAAKKRQQQYKEITNQALQTIANTIDDKDKYTNGHSMRVAKYSKEMANRLGMSEEEQEQVYYIALMHDIGKIGIPDAILNKPGKLDDEEYEIMKTHTIIGANILKDFTAVPHIGDGALGHHENYNGKGYPNGVISRKQPIVVQIIRVADTYDAMATKRAYRKPLDKEIIIAELEKYKGIDFNPEIEEVMLTMIEDGFVEE